MTDWRAELILCLGFCLGRKRRRTGEQQEVATYGKTQHISFNKLSPTGILCGTDVSIKPGRQPVRKWLLIMLKDWLKRVAKESRLPLAYIALALCRELVGCLRAAPLFIVGLCMEDY